MGAFGQLVEAFDESVEALTKLLGSAATPTLAARCSSLSYYDTLRAAVLPTAQCVQAQRDCFGGHGFKRLDMSGTFSTKWGQ